MAAQLLPIPLQVTELLYDLLAATITSKFKSSFVDQNSDYVIGVLPHATYSKSEST